MLTPNTQPSSNQQMHEPTLGRTTLLLATSANIHTVKNHHRLHHNQRFSIGVNEHLLNLFHSKSGNTNKKSSKYKIPKPSSFRICSKTS